MQSKAKTVAAYLAELPADRRAAIEAVRRVILKNLDNDYEEGMLHGGICYSVRREVFPAGYHCDPSKPLCLAGVGSQKNYISLGLMWVYASKEEELRFRKAWAKSGAKALDMGRCCIRFKRLEDIPLEVIGEAVRRIPARQYVERYLKAIESARSARTQAHLAKARATTPGAAKKGVKKKASKRAATR